MDSQEFHLDILGQQPSLKLYTQICFCFPLNESESKEKLIQTLNNGLQGLSKAFPWVTGQVVQEVSHEDNSKVFKIKPLNAVPQLAVSGIQKDLLASLPSMDRLRKAKFPFNLLDESHFAPRNTYIVPAAPEKAGFDTDPVLLLQATFIPGGLILEIQAHHCVMDGHGQGQLINFFNKACRNEPFTLEELSSGNIDRRSLVPLIDGTLDSGLRTTSTEENHTTLSDSSAPDLQNSPVPVKCTWAYFNFPPLALQDLKSHATSFLSSAAKYISTDDAITALTWQSVTRARLSRLSAPPDLCRPVKFARAVNVRRYFNVPSTYPGLLQNMTVHEIAMIWTLDWGWDCRKR